MKFISKNSGAGRIKSVPRLYYPLQIVRVLNGLTAVHGRTGVTSVRVETVLEIICSFSCFFHSS